MAAVAKWRSDLGYSITTAGTSTAYTVTSNSVFDTLANMDGQRLCLKFHTPNGASPTLNVDGLGAKSIQYNAATVVGSGDFGTNAQADLVYDNANSIWRVLAGAQIFDSGTLMLFQQTSAPTGWTKQTTHNDKTLRVVSSTASSGGSTAFTTVFTTRTIAQANLPSYNLSLGSVTASVSGGTKGGTGTVSTYTIGSGSGTAPSGSSDIAVSIGGTLPSGGSGTTMDFAVQYVDIIIAAKT